MVNIRGNYPQLVKPFRRPAAFEGKIEGRTFQVGESLLFISWFIFQVNILVVHFFRMVIGEPLLI